jgi:Uncharacterized conserved protein
MADCCCTPPPLKDFHRDNASAFRRVLWAVLAINALMFLVEIGAGLVAGSASLQADALDFFGDAANYAISLMVVGMALGYRATAALAKGATMGLFGLWVIGAVVWHAVHGTLPSAFTMGAVGFAALVANAASFGLLWAYRGGDANMRSASTLEKVHEPIFAPIEFELDIAARRARLVVPGVTEGRGEPILNPVTGAEHRVRIDMVDSFEYTLAEIGRGWTKTQPPIQLELADSYGQFAEIHLCQSGVVR